MQGQKTPRFSYSRLTSFTGCPKKYKFRYIDHETEAFDSVETFLGKSVHSVLEWLYKEHTPANPPTKKKVLDTFRQNWAKSLSPRVKIVKLGQTMEDYSDKGAAFLLDHFDRAFMTDTLGTVDTEWQFNLALDEEIEFTGFVDRIGKAPDGTLYVIDFKTSSESEVKDEMKLQMRAYGAAVCKKMEVPKMVLRLHFLVDDRREEWEFKPDSADDVLASLRKMTTDVLAAEDFPAKPSRLCAWCGFNTICDEGARELGIGKSAAAAKSMVCPKCKGKLRERTGKFGRFIGCSNYPNCKFTRNV